MATSTRTTGSQLSRQVLIKLFGKLPAASSDPAWSLSTNQTVVKNVEHMFDQGVGGEGGAIGGGG
ncbi:MAG: hypothetical protein HY038_11485 [Nitrospirae bacterium]|nr:hypothetical protein [Nitrospirota bacterium]